MVRLHRLPDLEAQDVVSAQRRRELDERLENEAQEHHWQASDQKHLADLTEQELLQKRALVGQVGMLMLGEDMPSTEQIRLLPSAPKVPD